MAHPPTVGGVRCPRGVARGFGGRVKVTSALWEWLKGETRSHVTYVERKQIWVKCRGKMEVVGWIR